MWKITNDLVTQVQELFGNVTSLEEEKKNATESTEKLINAMKEKKSKRDCKTRSRGSHIAMSGDRARGFR